MAKPLIVLTNPFLPEIFKKELAPHARLKYVKTRAALERAIVHADALITRVFDPVDDALLSRAKNLRVVGNFGVGLDNIDRAAAARRGIAVVNTPGVLTRATAELAVTLLFAAARRVPEGEALCRSGRFRGWTPTMLLGQELHGRYAVLVGRGRIGLATARLFRALGLRITWITRDDSPREIEQKLKTAQILSLHFSLNPSTRHWLDARRLALLPKDAIVLNTTRGPTIDEKALIRALQKKQIFAAGLDVYENEPDIPKALRKLPNVVLLPHLGSATREAREGMARSVISRVLANLV